MYIQSLVKNASWDKLYGLVSQQHSSINLEIHDALMTETNVLVQYYFIKALKVAGEEANNFKPYLQFASDSSVSIHGSKAIFRNILDNLYDKPDSLVYCHPVKKGLPKVIDFLAIAKQYIK